MRITTFFASVLLCAAAFPQQTVRVEITDYFNTMIYHSPETPGYTSWVGLWQLPDATVRCDFRQVTGPKDNPVSSVPVLETRDEGRTWKVLDAAAPTADAGLLGGYAVSSDGCRGMAVLPDGTLVRPVWGSSDFKDSGAVRRSTDHGKTWSEHIYFLPVAEYRTWPTLIHPLRDGRLVLFAGCWKRGDTTAGKRDDALFAGGQEGMLPNMTKMMFLSSDEGLTWSAPIVLMPATVGVCEESDFCELPNGDLFWVHRVEHYPDHQTEMPPLAAKMGPTPPGSYWYSDRMQSVAHKQGDTFVPGPCESAPFPHSGFPCVLMTREGIILHLATGESQWTADEGKTWHKLMVGDKPLGTYYYPKAIQLADGMIICIGHDGSDDAYGTVDQSVRQQRFRLKSQNEETTNKSALSNDARTKIDSFLDFELGVFEKKQCDELFKTADRDVLIAYLINVMRDEKRDWRARQRAAYALAQSGDARGAAASLELIRSYLKPERVQLSLADGRVLYTSIYNLGRYNLNETEKVAFSLLPTDFWIGRGMPIPGDGKDSKYTAQDFREAALVGLSYAGTDGAVKAFETGEGIPQDLWLARRGEMAVFADSARRARNDRLTK